MKTSVYIGTSLDGFIARENGDIGWLTQFANEEAFRDYNAFMNRIDAIVIGSGTFEKVLTFPKWPYQKKVFVLSNRLKQVPDALKEQVTLHTLQPAALLEHLSGEGFSNIYVDGGKVIQSFLKENLIDELIISRVPVLIGSGIPLFGGLTDDLYFQHIQTEVYANGLAKNYYERKRD